MYKKSNRMRVAEMCRNRKTAACVVVIVVFSCVLLLKEFLRPGDRICLIYDSGERLILGNDNIPIQKDDVTNILIAQRNNVSRVLNLKQQKLGQLECEVSFFSNPLNLKMKYYINIIIIIIVFIIIVSTAREPFCPEPKQKPPRVIIDHDLNCRFAKLVIKTAVIIVYDCSDLA